jgi:nicotinamide mononucleotide transporter
VIDTLLLLIQPALQPAFTLLNTPVTWLELVAFALALAMVGFNIRVNPWGWPLAIVSSLLYFGLFWNSRLYGDAALQIFFAVIAVWGWWQWLPGQNQGQALHVRALPVAHRAGLLLAMGLMWPATGWFLKTYTDTDVPWWDAFPTAASVIAQWLLGRKYAENWLVWMVVNLVSVALFAYKGLWLTALLYAIFCALSVVGWRAWMGKVAA